MKTKKPKRFRLLLLSAALLLGGAGYVARDELGAGMAHGKRVWEQCRPLFRMPNAEDRKSAPSISAPPAPPAADAGSESIAIYFAPAERLNPWGIDDRLIAFINSARETIDAAFYDLQLDSVAQALIEQHRRRVRVRLVSDSHYEAREALQACVQAGIPVVLDRRNAFMHNKFCVVDACRTWTGSTNITENCMFLNNNNAFVFEMIPMAKNFTAEFEEMFVKKAFGKHSPRNTPFPNMTIGTVAVECYFAPEDGVEQALIDLIRQARSCIEFMAFAFTSKPLAEAMAERIAGGVAVRGIMESRDMGSPYCQDNFLIAKGAKIVPDHNPYALHHKVMVVDRKTVASGSYNFTRSAEDENDENLIIVHDSDIARKFAEEFESLVKP